MNLMLEMLMNNFTDSVQRDWLCSIDIAYAYDKIPYLLKILCEKFGADHGYIHEISSENTIEDRFEYLESEERKREISEEYQFLNIMTGHISFLKENSYFLLEDVDELKAEFPFAYSMLKVSGVKRCAHVPIYVNDVFYGYLALENFREEAGEEALRFMVDASEFLSKLLKQKQILEKYKYLSSHDHMTGALNSYSYDEELQKAHIYSSLGVVYYRVFSNEKRQNVDLFFNHDAIKDFYGIIEQVFKDYKIFRISCDEFVILCPETSISSFNFLLFMANKAFDNKQFIPYGSAFSDESVNIHLLISEARNNLEEAIHGNEIRGCEEEFSQKLQTEITEEFDETCYDTQMRLCKFNSHFNQFINSNYFDIEFFFDSMSLTDHYPFFGDISNNLFCICDEMKELFGFESNIVSDLIKVWEERIPHASDLELFRSDVRAVLTGEKKEHNIIYRVITANGDEIWVECSGIVKFDHENKPKFFSGFVKKMEYSFIIDPISDLAREGVALIKIKELKDRGYEPTFIGFKLNYFDDINSSQGREVGNALICDISSRLRETFRDSVKFYRLDGLRFLAITMPNYEHDFEGVVDQIHMIVNEMYAFYNMAISNPCSIGIIDKEIKLQNGPEIISNILNVIELAKNHSNSKYFSYSSSDLHDKMQKSKMAIALHNNVFDHFENFRVVIQPVIRAEDMSIHSGEMLLRWKFEGEDIPPSVFIPILEKSNLIITVGRWVFEQAVKHVKRIRILLPDFKLNFNISYNQIKDDTFVNSMEEFLKKSGVNADELIMELTETHYNEDPNKLLDFIKSCKNLGLNIALDDFGSGYSSMELLLKYPSDIVKLDRSLINQISESDESKEFINSIVYACHQFNKFVCVEGVETQEELKFALDMGCEMIQGYHFYRPMEIEDFYKEVVNEKR